MGVFRLTRTTPLFCNLFLLKTYKYYNTKNNKMTEYKDFKVGDAVKHKFRERKYQKGVIISIDEHRLPLIKIMFEDGFYKSNEESEIPYMDIVKLK